MQFRYLAYTVDDGVVRGRLEAGDESEARSEVVRRGYKPLRVWPAWKLPSVDDLFPSLFQVRAGELIRFSKVLATILSSGGSLAKALALLEAESRNRTMRRTLASVRASLDEGASVSEALAQHPGVFDALFVSVVEVGEYTGHLAPALGQMAEMLERGRQARQKAIHTMMYPLAIVGLSVVTLGVLMAVALPPLLTVFDQMGAETPALTRAAVAMVGGLDRSYPFIIVAVGFATGLALAARRFRRTRMWLDRALARVPVLGPLVLAGELSRFCRTMAMLMEAGVPLATALNLGISGSKNLAVREALIEAEESLLSGHGLTDALVRCPVLPRMFVELVRIGEETNSLQRTMDDAAESYEKDFERSIDTFVGVLEPASTLAVGLIVGFIAFSMFVPIYSSLSALD